MGEFLYLVILSHGMDDIPVQLFNDRDQAFGLAESLDWDAPEDILQRLELPQCSTPCCITVTTFRDGLPISRVIVRYFMEDDE